jgi:hypothetical protein
MWAYNEHGRATQPLKEVYVEAWEHVVHRPAKVKHGTAVLKDSISHHWPFIVGNVAGVMHPNGLRFVEFLVQSSLFPDLLLLGLILFIFNFLDLGFILAFALTFFLSFLFHGSVILNLLYKPLVMWQK